MPPAPPPPAIDPDPIFAETASWAGRALILSFIGAVVGPTFLAMLYFGLLASDQFVSEIRLSVRAASEQRQQATDALSAFSKLGLAAAKTSTQDAYMVVNYVRSKPAVFDVGGPDFLEKVYSKPEIDWFSRLSPGEPLENIWKYWNRHVVASLDTLSSIVTVKVFAYTPEDAQALAARADSVMKAAEKVLTQRLKQAFGEKCQAETVLITGCPHGLKPTSHHLGVAVLAPGRNFRTTRCWIPRLFSPFNC